MSVSMYQISVPVFARAMGNLRAVLQKGAAHAEAKKFKPEVLLNGSVSRLAGVEIPKYEDKETTFEELYARIDKTLAYIKEFKPEQIDGSEGKQITMQTPRGNLEFKGQDYLLFFVQPNVYFHCTTAYDILRHNGVEIGKMDFIGKP
jgi:hypothetical protein